MGPQITAGEDGKTVGALSQPSKVDVNTTAFASDDYVGDFLPLRN